MRLQPRGVFGSVVVSAFILLGGQSAALAKPLVAESPSEAFAVPTEVTSSQYLDMHTAEPMQFTLTPLKAAPTVYESGIASTYGEGDGFEGNRTACGQIFHTSVVQVAHKTLPCGTKLRIEDTDTGKTVEAEVTDRGPYIRGRIVDLSWGAFKELHPTGPDLRHVNIYVLDAE